MVQRMRRLRPRGEHLRTRVTGVQQRAGFAADTRSTGRCSTLPSPLGRVLLPACYTREQRGWISMRGQYLRLCERVCREAESHGLSHA